MISSSYFWKIKWVQWKFREARSKNATGHAWIFEKRLFERDPLHFISQWKQKSVYLSPWMLHAFLAIDATLLHVLFSIWIGWSLMYKTEITSRLREMFLRHRTYHTTSWWHRVAFAWPPGVLLAKNSHLRVAFVWSFGDTRCLHDGYPRASRSRVAFLTQSVNFVCPSCCPRVWFGRHRVAFRSHRDAFGWKLFCYHLRE